jgi:hypothetical protein
VAPDRDDRAVAPVAGKLLEIGLVILFVGLLTTTLHGGVVPGYRTEAGDRVGERALVGAAQRVADAVPPPARSARVTLAVDLPDTLRGTAYAVRVHRRTLVLDHPDPGIGARARLALPDRVVRVAGRWRSDRPAAVTVRTTDAGAIVEQHRPERPPGG